MTHKSKLITILFADRGEVYKIVQWTDNGTIKTELRDKFQVIPEDEKIEAMEISSKHQSIYVASRNRVKQINLKMCERLKNNSIDPYCELDSDENNCKPTEPRFSMFYYLVYLLND